MRCPFLHKMNVKYCGLYRQTMIPLGGTDLATERCSQPGFRDCPLLTATRDTLPAADQCPHLCVADVHYCEAAPVRKLIPCNRTAVSRCTDDGHRHCQLYLAMADPAPETDDPEEPGDPPSPAPVEAIPMPGPLAYAPNHMWLDRTGGTTCHVGVDAFFARALGRIDGISYPYHRDGGRPVARFLVGSAALDLTFPNPMHAHEINAHLVVDPTEVLRDPYGRGWLFEGVTVPADPLDRGLRRGAEARHWMESECDRLAAFAHDQLTDGRVMNDGGRCRGDLAQRLDAGGLLRLHAEFFALKGRRETP